MTIYAGHNHQAAARNIISASIASGASVTDTIDLADAALAGIIMPAAWTAASLTIEVSADNGTWIGVARDDLGNQCNVISSALALVSTAHQLNMVGLLPYRYVRLRSGTTASPVNQAAERSITVITRPLA